MAFDDAAGGAGGTLQVGEDRFPLRVQNLPTVVEGWKSLDDQNLVKCLDIGQALVAYPPGGAPPLRGGAPLAAAGRARVGGRAAPCAYCARRGRGPCGGADGWRQMTVGAITVQ